MRVSSKDAPFGLTQVAIFAQHWVDDAAGSRTKSSTTYGIQFRFTEISESSFRAKCCSVERFTEKQFTPPGGSVDRPAASQK